MSVNVILGEVSDSIKQSKFREGVEIYFEESGDEGILYLGYSLTKNAEEMLRTDALLIGKNCGVVAFNFSSQATDDLETIYEEQDKLFNKLDFYFRMYPALMDRRRLFFDFRVASIVPAVDFDFDEKNYSIITTENLPQFLSEGENLSEESYSRICEALQKIGGMKPAKERANVENINSLGGKIKEIEKQIANMDIWQQKAAMENPDGPKRIRGLAGSGKTIILAWKAAYLHAIHPEWNIVVTFWSKSLYDQFRRLITRFYYRHSDEPLNWDKLQVLHAWGGRDVGPGIYYKATREVGVSPVNYGEAKNKYGMDLAFNGVCEELLKNFTEVKPMFDAVLIDEAQDLPISFFKIIYKLTKSPKRIIWAYDELQNIKNVNMPEAEVMFGLGDKDKDDFSLANIYGEPMRDISLNVCYRNPIWSLAVAHALGFGIYRKPTDRTFFEKGKVVKRKEDFGIVQMFDEPETWEDVGYQCIAGELKQGEEVKLRRSKDATPNYFAELLTPQDCLQFQKFESEDKQYAWVAEQIQKNITEDELEPDDILIIFAASNTSNVSSKYVTLQRFLYDKKINSMLADGKTFREVGKISCSQIYRAKGNEAPMVYVVNSENCAGRSIGGRNIIFTAITRARAWVRILGVGSAMDTLIEEINSCVVNDYALQFKYPTPDELKKIRSLKSDSKKGRGKKSNPELIDWFNSLSSKAKNEFLQKANGTDVVDFYHSLSLPEKEYLYNK